MLAAGLPAGTHMSLFLQSGCHATHQISASSPDIICFPHKDQELMPDLWMASVLDDSCLSYALAAGHVIP